jgi:Carboxypeptidase regulatory-like domain/Bacterial Ig-like domain
MRAPGRASTFLSLSLVGALLACARIEPPPGGPPDAEPPKLIATIPDSMAQVPGFHGNVEFRFDEVVSEGSTASTGTGTGDLEKLIILSPTTRVPDVTWRRSRITVRPAEGWRADRVYRVELLPGVTDLRRNRSDEGKVVTFSTGGPPPTTTLQGTVVDWTSARPAQEALVVALLLPDSLPYRAVTDSSGRFAFGPLPAGEYLVSGGLDQNTNHQLDGREAFDSVRLARGRTDAGELWAFVHDTTPPRIRSITVGDSVSATVELSQSIDPRVHLDVKAATVGLLPDSTPVPVVSLLPKPVDDSIHGAATGAADSLKADSLRADSLRADSLLPDTALAPARGRGGRPRVRAAENQPLTSRPALTDRLVVRVARPWTPGAKYAISVRALRNPSGATGDAVGTLVVPERPAVDSTAAADSLRTRPDSQAVKSKRKQTQGTPKVPPKFRKPPAPTSP